MRQRKYTRADWFENFMAARLVKESTESGRKAGLIRGSSAGVTCKRRLAYAIMGYEPLPNSADSCWTLNVGNGLHDMVQMMMANWGLVNAKAHVTESGSIAWTGDAEGDVLDKENGIFGHYDGLTREIKGKRWLLEFKTCTDKPKTIAIFAEDLGGQCVTQKYVVGVGQSAFSPEIQKLVGSPPKPIVNRGNEELLEVAVSMGVCDAKGSWLALAGGRALVEVLVQPGKFSKLDAPSIEHVTQASYYAKTLGADGCLVIYLAKDQDQAMYLDESLYNIPVKAFAFDPDLAAVEVFEERAKSVWESIEADSLPPKQFEPGKPGSECSWCSYSHLCHPDHPEVRARHERVVQELRVIGKELSDEPWVTHSRDEIGAKLIERGIKDGHS